MLSATQGLAKLSFFKYVDFEMMDHNNRAGAYEWGLQTLNISIEVCATWSNHSEKCTKWKYIKKAAGMKENKQRNIDKTLCGLGKIYSCCIWIISYIFMHVYIYFQYTERFLTSSFPCFEGQGSELAPFPCKSRSHACAREPRSPAPAGARGACSPGAMLRGDHHPCPNSGKWISTCFMFDSWGTLWKIHLVIH